MFVTCGLNHKSAPLAVRELIASAFTPHHTTLTRLIEHPGIQEAALLSTCNRTEFYCEVSDVDALLPWLSSQPLLMDTPIQPYFYLHQGHDGFRHALKVASGLDSMMLGEPQIFGQMKKAYQDACEAGTISGVLQETFQSIFSATKRIRQQSGIGKNPISIAFSAVQLIRQSFKALDSVTVFLIGSGETSSLVGKYLSEAGVTKFLVASRTHAHAKTLAKTYQATALTISDIPEYLAQADVVISATACPMPFITQGLVKQALKQRAQKPMLLLDLAVPRDIEPDVAQLTSVQLYNIDDLEQRIEKGMEERREAAIKAEQLIDEELEHYIRWHRSKKATGLICDYRQTMQMVYESELDRAVKKLESGQCQLEVLNEFGSRLVNKLLHKPSVGLRRAARDDQQTLLNLVRYLLNKPKSVQTS